MLANKYCSMNDIWNVFSDTWAFSYYTCVWTVCSSICLYDLNLSPVFQNWTVIPSLKILLLYNYYLMFSDHGFSVFFLCPLTFILLSTKITKQSLKSEVPKNCYPIVKLVDFRENIFWRPYWGGSTSPSLVWQWLEVVFDGEQGLVTHFRLQFFHREAPWLEGSIRGRDPLIKKRWRG